MIQFGKNELTGSFDTLLADGKPYKFKTNTATISSYILYRKKKKISAFNDFHKNVYIYYFYFERANPKICKCMNEQFSTSIISVH